jgi:hypothetical protein
MNLEEAKSKFKIKQEKHYVWGRVADGGRFIHTLQYKTAWGVYDGSKMIYGGFAGGSNTRPSRKVVNSKKEAQSFVDGYENFLKMGEFDALRAAHKNGRNGAMQKAYRNGVQHATRTNKLKTFKEFIQS